MSLNSITTRRHQYHLSWVYPSLVHSLHSSYIKLYLYVFCISLWRVLCKEGDTCVVKIQIQKFTSFSCTADNQSLSWSCQKIFSHSLLHSFVTYFIACSVCNPLPIHKTLQHFMIHQLTSFHLAQSQGTIHLQRQDLPMELFPLSSLLQFQEFQDQRLMLSVLSMHDPKTMNKRKNIS